MAFVQLWSDYECNGGSIVVPEILGMEVAVHLRQLDGLDELTFQIPRKVWYNDPSDTEALIPGRVVRVEDDLSASVLEWRIARIVDSPNSPVVTVNADPVLYDLGNVMVRKVITGARTDYNLGGALATPEKYIDQFVMTSLAAVGWTWLSKGTITPADTYDLAWPGFSVLELLRDLEARTMSNLWLDRPDGDGYTINLGTRGSGATEVRCELNRNIIEVERIQEINNLVTVAQPFGYLADGAIELATIADNAWKVTAIDMDTPASGTDRLTVVDPNDATRGPLAASNQLDNLYLIFPDATLEKITDSELSGTTHYLYVADSSGVSVSDHVQVVADSAGTYLTELTHPTLSLDTSQGGYGRQLRRPENADFRGERNLVPNGLNNAWASGDLPDGWTTSAAMTSGKYARVDDATLQLVGAADGAQTSTSILVKDFPADAVLQEGTKADELARNLADSTTLDGSGAGTITLNASATVADNDPITIIRPDMNGFGGGTNAIIIGNSTSFLISPSITIQAPSTGDTLWATVGLSAFNTSGTSKNLTNDTIQLVMHDGSSTLASVTGPAATEAVASNATTDLTLRVAYALAADTDAEVRIQAQADANFNIFVRWVGLHLGPDPRIPPIDGSWANTLWHLANDTISNSISARYDLTLRDLASLNCYSSDETLTLGGTVRVLDDVLGMDFTARIVAIQTDLLDPMQTRVRLATNPTRSLDKTKNPRFAPRVQRPPVLQEVDNLDAEGEPDGTKTGAPRSPKGEEPVEAGFNFKVYA